MSKTSKLLIVILCIVITGAVAQYVAINRENNENIKIDSAESGQSAAGRPFKVGIVLSIGGLGDKSYNDLAYEGTRLAQEKLGIEFSYTEPATSIETEIEYGAHHLRQYAKEDYDLVIATGFLFKDACEKVAQEYPDVQFVIIDSVVAAPNVTSLTFKTNEGSFLVGAVAGMVTKTNTIGYIGAQDTEIFQEFRNGYEQGAVYVNPEVSIASRIVGGDNPFAVPNRGYELANELIAQQADVVYTVAGATGIGAIEACKEKGIYAIGVDSDQDYIAKGTVITSMMKKIDTAVYTAIELAMKGELKSGILEFNIANGGIDTSPFTHTRDQLPADALAKLDQIKKDIISGKIKLN
ncbi:BMP family lipoprotein [Acetobacterium wieringae]|uniref:BMP family lipoprotein n=1 Tax=Acetobacterium wieringae TaxID=52694 RepID=UPI0020347D73|nr:BMP family ABC transporter substrate-binding protein [Acetobacterium wieringae]URN82778.1 BMP family ABC transporter substrate-binding protein [Acetobacterium wieringae]